MTMNAYSSLDVPWDEWIAGPPPTYMEGQDFESSSLQGSVTDTFDSAAGLSQHEVSYHDDGLATSTLSETYTATGLTYDPYEGTYGTVTAHIVGTATASATEVDDGTRIDNGAADDHCLVEVGESLFAETLGPVGSPTPAEYSVTPLALSSTTYTGNEMGQDTITSGGGASVSGTLFTLGSGPPISSLMTPVPGFGPLNQPLDDMESDNWSHVPGALPGFTFFTEGPPIIATAFGVYPPDTDAMTPTGLIEQAVSLHDLPDGVWHASAPSPSGVLVALAAAGRNPTDLTLPTAGTEAVDPPPGSHETSGSQGWVSWITGGIASTASYAAQKVDQATGVAGTFVLTGQVVSMESASGAQLLGAAALGTAQGAANTVNGVQDAAIGTGNLVVKGVNAVAGYRVLDERVSPDWSRDRFVSEGETEHNVGKFLGGNGVITLATAGMGAVGAGARAAASSAEASQVVRMVVQADGTLAAATTGAAVAPAAVGVGVAAGASVGVVGNIVQMAAANPGGGGAPNSSGQNPTRRTVIEEPAAASKADKLTGRQKDAYERAIDELSQGISGQKDHALKGQGGLRARDLAGSGKGRGKDRILYKLNDDGTATIVDIGDYH